MSNSFERILSELVSQPQDRHFWFNASKDLFAYHYNRKRGLAIRRPRQGTIVELPLGVFLLCNNSSYTPQLAFHGEDNSSEFLCLEYSDTTAIDGPIAQAVLLDFCLKRYQIMVNPRAWYDTWAKMVGNTLAEVKPYPVLAELLMLKKLMEHGLVRNIAEEWTGPNKQLHDIELTDPAVSVEVKSSSERNRKMITVSSAYQLNPTGAKPLYLAFFIFQAASPDDGLTLEKVIQDFGPEYHDLLTEKSKIKEGGLGWNDKAATVVSCSYYRIDGNFPKITPSNFDGGIFPSGIVKIIYDVDLTGVAEITEEEFFSELNAVNEQNPPGGEVLVSEPAGNEIAAPLETDDAEENEGGEPKENEIIPAPDNEEQPANPPVEHQQGITCLEAAIQTLCRHNHPMNARQLVDAMIADGAFQFSPTARTPWNSVSTRLSTHINQCESEGRPCRIRRIDRGIYAPADYEN